MYKIQTLTRTTTRTRTHISPNNNPNNTPSNNRPPRPPQPTSTTTLTTFLPPLLCGSLTGLLISLFKLTVNSLLTLTYGTSTDITEAKQTLSYLPEQLIPAAGGVAVVLLTLLSTSHSSPTPTPTPTPTPPSPSKPTIKSASFNEASEYAVKMLKSIATLGTGNSLGPEQPCIDTGVFVSGMISRFLGEGAEKLETCHEPDNGSNNDLESTSVPRGGEVTTITPSVVATGVAAGVGGGFNAPVSGVFFALETSSSPQNLKTTPVSNLFLTSISSSLVTHAILNDDLAFKAGDLFVRNEPRELPLYIGLGVLSGLTSYALSIATSTLSSYKSSLPPSSPLSLSTPVLAGLLTGLIGTYRPRVLFFGYDTLNSLFTSTLDVKLLVTLLALKIVTTSTSTAGGLGGGQLAPSLFIGAVLGGAYHEIIAKVLDPDLLSGAPTYALIGAASVLSSKFKAPVFGAVLLFELTRDYDVLVPLMGSAWVGTKICEAVSEEGKRRSEKLGDLVE